MDEKNADVQALILAGGKSKRMGQDKAMLSYFGKNQIERCHELLKPFCQQIYLSQREQQYAENIFADIPRINDRFLDFGPLSGILSAMHSQPEVAWLVIACDLPFLNHETLARLFRERNPDKMASVYANEQGLIEPLCTIYEPKIRFSLFEAMAQRKYCPRKILRDLPCQILKLDDDKVLSNINFKSEYLKTQQSF